MQTWDLMDSTPASRKALEELLDNFKTSLLRDHEQGCPVLIRKETLTRPTDDGQDLIVASEITTFITQEPRK